MPIINPKHSHSIKLTGNTRPRSRINLFWREVFMLVEWLQNGLDGSSAFFGLSEIIFHKYNFTKFNYKHFSISTKVKRNKLFRPNKNGICKSSKFVCPALCAGVVKASFRPYLWYILGLCSTASILLMKWCQACQKHLLRSSPFIQHHSHILLVPILYPIDPIEMRLSSNFASKTFNSC